jgi:hypothetical protein
MGLSFFGGELPSARAAGFYRRFHRITPDPVRRETTVARWSDKRAGRVSEWETGGLSTVLRGATAHRGQSDGLLIDGVALF